MQYIIKYGEYSIYQGSRGPASDDKVLAKHKITQVLSITNVTLQPIRKACRWVLPVDDNNGWTEEQIDFVKTFCEFVQKNDYIALIHCDHGISRSSGGMIIWHMVMTNSSKDEAYNWVRLLNPYVNCHQEIFNSIPERFS